MGTPLELEQLVKGGESTQLELKEGLDKESIGRLIAAFANNYHDQGRGLIVLGVREMDRIAMGLSFDTERLQQVVADLCREIMPLFFSLADCLSASFHGLPLTLYALTARALAQG